MVHVTYVKWNYGPIQLLVKLPRMILFKALTALFFSASQEYIVYGCNNHTGSEFAIYIDVNRKLYECLKMCRTINRTLETKMEGTLELNFTKQLLMLFYYMVLIHQSYVVQWERADRNNNQLATRDERSKCDIREK